MKPQIEFNLRYGIIIGLAGIGYVVAQYLLGFHTTNFKAGQMAGYFAIAIPVVGLYFAVKEKVEIADGKRYGNKEGFGIGLRISAISSILTAIFGYIYNTFINPAFVDQAIVMMRDDLASKGVIPEQIERQVAMIKLLEGPLSIPLNVLSLTLLGGIITWLWSRFLGHKKLPEQAG